MQIWRWQAAGRAVALFVGLWLASGAAWAGLQVSPLSLAIKAPLTATPLWIRNTGRNPVHIQVRLFQWTQVDGKDKLTPSRALVASPPVAAIQPGEKQLIRVIRVGPPPVGPDADEAAYRLIVHQLPTGLPDTPGLHFIFKFRLPLFVEPAGVKRLAPKLHWSVHLSNGKAVLDIANAGNQHARLTQLSFTNRDGQHTTLDKGLFGYVLAGSHRDWTLKPPATLFAGGGTFRVEINGKPVTQVVAPATPASP